jgi:hypothetical protein
MKHLHFDFELPEELYGKLSSLYQSAFAVQEYFKIFLGCYDYNALYIFKEKPEESHMLYYMRRPKEVILLNELFEINGAYLTYFADFIFRKYPLVQTITLNRIKKHCVEDIPYPLVLLSSSEDIVLALPPSKEEYKASLSKHTKKNLQNYMNRMRREHPDFAFDVYEAGDFNSSAVSKIIAMNKIRMTSKKIKSGFDLGQERKIIDFCRKFGMISEVRVNGEIISGTICYVLGSHVFLETLSYDTAYNKSRIAQTTLYLTIQELIDRGMTHLHMLWGDYEYKYRFRGVKVDLVSVSVFRAKGLRYHRAKIYHASGRKFARFKTNVRLLLTRMHLYKG